MRRARSATGASTILPSITATPRPAACASSRAVTILRARVISSPDGEAWESMAFISEAGVDLRDPKLSVTPDGRLMLLGDRSTWSQAGEQTYRSWVSFSDDGARWTPPQRILGDGEWLWRVTWVEGQALGVAYFRSKEKGTWMSRLYASQGGVDYERLVEFSVLPGLTEATLRAGDAGVLHCLHRRDEGTSTALLGTGRPPWKEWTWKDCGFYFGGPNVLLHGGRWYAAGRWMVGPPRTVLARVGWERGTLEPVLELPSGGDTSYPGLVSQGNELWISYYSSHEGKTAIYLARVETE